MGKLIYCTTCLITDVKMYSYKPTLFRTKINEIFLEILRVSKDSNCKLWFCYECAAFIQKTEKFISKCHRAQDVLLILQQDNNQVTMKDLQSVNRLKHNLESTISASPTNCISISDIQDEDITVPVFNDIFITSIKENLDYNITNCIDNIIKTEYDESDNIENDGTQPILEGSNNYDYYNTENDGDIDDNHIHQKRQTSEKEHKSKKRKKVDIHTKDTVESVSDDEPLANKVSKTDKVPKVNDINKQTNVRNFDISYFDDYATVIFLTPEDAKKELLLRKESSNYINSPFKCEFCYRGYEAKTAFQNHMKKHSSDYGEFKCDICHLRFPEQRCLCKHRLASHKRKFSCKLCPYVCFCTHQAKTHVSLHKGKKYPCKECGEIFSLPNSLLMHKRLKHLTECVCELCGDMFATPRGLYSHTTKIHRQDKNEKLGPKCEECCIHFATEKAWKRHLVLSSKHDVSNGCKSCGDTFPNAEELKRHSRVHARKHGPRPELKLPANCAICGQYVVDRAEYKSHMTSAHPGSDITKKLDTEELTPFVCELCGLAFKKQCFLKYHQRAHTGERPFLCPDCPKAFPRRASLASHRAGHARRAPCLVCRRSFAYRSALNKHMKVHLNIRPHKCDICEKAFISPCDVRLHIKYVHNKVPWPKRNRKGHEPAPPLY